MFSNRVVEVWNSLPETVVMTPSLNSFKNRLNKAWKNHPSKFSAQVLYSRNSYWNCSISKCVLRSMGWSGGAMVLGKLPVPGRPTILITVGQGPVALAVGAGGVVWTFLLSSILFPLSPSLCETARYRLKYCLKGPLNPKQPTNQLKKQNCLNRRRDQ